MKKPLKFLALILSSLILASSAEFTEAAKPKTSHNRHLQKTQTSSNILDNVVKFKSQIPKGGIWIETTMGDTCITKEKLESVNTEKMTKLAPNFESQNFKGYIIHCDSFDINLASTFEQYQTMVSAMSVFEKNRIDEEDLIDFLCIAHRNQTEIPDELNFNSVQMLCYDKISIFNLLQGGKRVFTFHILTGNTINTISEILSPEELEESSDNPMDKISDLKKKVLVSGISIESEMGDTRIEKKEIDKVSSYLISRIKLILNSRRLSSTNMSDFINDFECYHTILSVITANKRNKIEKKILINLLYMAQIKEVKIPDVLNFNSAYIYCSDRNVICSLKKDGKIVFVFLIPIDK